MYPLELGSTILARDVAMYFCVSTPTSPFGYWLQSFVLWKINCPLVDAGWHEFINVSIREVFSPLFSWSLTCSVPALRICFWKSSNSHPTPPQDFLTDGIFSQRGHNTYFSFQIEPSLGILETTVILETFSTLTTAKVALNKGIALHPLWKMNALQSRSKQLIVKLPLYARDFLPNRLTLMNYCHSG